MTDGTNTVLSVPRAIKRCALVLGVVATADQLTKHLTVRHLEGNPIDLILGIRLVSARNTGVAFSRGSNLAGIIFVVLAVTALISWVAWKEFKHPQGSATWAPVGFGLILGGAWGNVIDRLFRGKRWGRGAVVDMVDVGWWPVFNLADAALSCGVITVIVGMYLNDRRRRETVSGAVETGGDQTPAAEAEASS
jgi:signal peptidase II